MRGDPFILVYLQLADSGLHPVSRRILTTARALGAEKQWQVQGVLFGKSLSEPVRQELEVSGLSKIFCYVGEAFGGFLPECQAEILTRLGDPEIFLFPATPEGRTLSSMMGARLHTGVTADCTALSFGADGRLEQVRPAFSGNRLAKIRTPEGPQLASLRFASQVREPEEKTEVQEIPVSMKAPYTVSWLDRSVQQENKKKVVLAIGGGIRAREDISLFKALAEKLGAELYCSRSLVDRGWMEKRQQIGLSGGSISADLLITLGVSGSLQFQAGLQEIRHLLVVDQDPHTALMALADTPIQGDLYEIAEALQKA